MSLGNVLITGANRGIGLEFVKQLTALQTPPKHIFASCRNPDAANVSLIFLLHFLVIWFKKKKISEIGQCIAKFNSIELLSNLTSEKNS